MLSFTIDTRPFLREAGFKGHFVGVVNSIRAWAFGEWSDLGNWVVEKLIKYIEEYPPRTGKEYNIVGSMAWKAGKKHKASAAYEAPAILFGKLIRSFEWELFWMKRKTVLALRVRNIAEYAHRLEYGTPKMDERPFMEPVIYGSEFKKEIEKRLNNIFRWRF